MKYRKLPQFDADYRGLSADERSKFREFITQAFLPAMREYESSPQTYRWPKGIRFESITGAPGVYAVTWSFSGPDGRATFQFDDVDGERFLVWRRVGRHAIYRNP